MKINYTPLASKQFSRLDKPIQIRIKKYMTEVTALDDPSSRGKGLTANLSGLWRYRVGDYRILCCIKDDELIVTVLVIGHRSSVYE